MLKILYGWLRRMKMNKQKHIKIHEELHEKLDMLVADFIIHTGKPLSKTSILDLMIWSNSQTVLPDEKDLQEAL